MTDLKDSVQAAIKSAGDEITDKILSKHGLPADPQKWTKNNSEALVKAFIECGELAFSGSKQPMEYLKHYAEGKGTEKEFDLSELFSEERGAQERVFSEVRRRVLKINTVSEKRAATRSSSMYPDGIDPVVTIFQHNFSTMKWWASLGTYNITFEAIGTRAGGREIVVRLEGSGLYTWHSDRKGASEKIHAIGLKLLDFGVASEFSIKGKSCTCMVDSIAREATSIATTKQSNPKDNQLMIGMAWEATKKNPEVAAKYLGQVIKAALTPK